MSAVAMFGGVAAKGSRPKRGRPVLEHDNRRVRAFLSDYLVLSDLVETYPLLDDVLTGACAAKTEGDTATRPLSKARIFDVLAHCDVVCTRATLAVLSWANYGVATIARYTQAARTASLFVARELDRAAM